MVNSNNHNNKDGRKPRLRFNIIDLIIILFMLLAIVGIAWRYNIADQVNFRARGATFEIEFHIASIMRGTEYSIRAGERFYVGIDSVEIGVIWEILDVRDAVAYVEMLDGTIVRTYVPERVDVTGIMRSVGRVSPEGNYLIGGTRHVSANSTFFVHTGRRENWITVISVRVLD